MPIIFITAVSRGDHPGPRHQGRAVDSFSKPFGKNVINHLDVGSQRRQNRIASASRRSRRVGFCSDQPDSPIT